MREGSVRARACAAGSEAQKFGRYEIFFGVSPGWGGENRGGGQKTGAGKIGVGDKRSGREKEEREIKRTGEELRGQKQK